MRRRALAHDRQAQEFYTPGEAATFVRVGESTIRNAIRTRKLPISGPTDHPIIAHEDLMVWVWSVRQVRGGTQSEHQQAPPLIPPRTNETPGGEPARTAEATDEP